MSIDINNINPNRPDNSLRKQSGKLANDSGASAPSPAAPSGSETSGESVSLSDTAKSLAQIESELKTLPSFDQNKVDAIKARIASGEYHIDSEKLAQKMLDMES